MKKYILSGKIYNCPLILSLDIISGKWKGIIIWFLLENKVLRYGQIKTKINQAKKITEKMLAQCLRELERDGIIQRKVYPVIPPKVEYTLTPKGKKLKPVFNELIRFGMGYKGYE